MLKLLFGRAAAKAKEASKTRPNLEADVKILFARRLLASRTYFDCFVLSF